MNDIAIQVENLSKRYRIGLKEGQPETLVAAMTGWLRSPLANYRQLRRLSQFGEDGHDAEDILWALKDVSFEVKQGEVVGIIGRNGAGKTTLLKILSRITEPTSGRAVINGRVSSLLEVGTGFHPELTGRENVYLNGTLLGMTKAEVDHKFDQIVDFSGVEKFIDTPVKRYSSGMQVRLAFSVAVFLDPEILIIDEVLAVGDISFQKKCLDKMQEVTGRGRTVLFVSHNMSAIRRLCHRVILLENGKIIYKGDENKAIDKFISISEQNGDIRNRMGNGKARVTEVVFEQDDRQVKDIGVFEDVIIKLCIIAYDEIEDSIIGIKLLDRERNIVYATNSSIISTDPMPLRRGVNEMRFRLQKVPLQNGSYNLTVSIQPKGTGIFMYEYFDRVENIANFSVFGSDNNHGIVNIRTAILS